MTFSLLLERALRLANAEPRAIIGIAGCPGAGKSTLAAWLVQQLTAAGVPTAWTPMDGFHLADVELERLGLRDRKGAVETFDVHGYLALLRRLRAETGNVVYAPGFERDLEQPLAAAIPAPPETRVVVTEGNYLLVDVGAWRQVRAALSEVWHVEVADTVRRERLVRRHIEFGKSPEAARRWVEEVDEANAAVAQAGRDAADLIVDGTSGQTRQPAHRPKPPRTSGPVKGR